MVERNPRIGGGCSTDSDRLPGFRLNLHANFYMGMSHLPADRGPRASSLRIFLYRAAGAAGGGLPRWHWDRHLQGSRQILRLARAFFQAGRRDLPEPLGTLSGMLAPTPTSRDALERVHSHTCHTRPPVISCSTTTQPFIASLTTFIVWHAHGGDDLDLTFRKYLFLTHYGNEILAHMPPGKTWDDGPDWWEQAIADWQAARQPADLCMTPRLPLLALANEARLPFRSRVALMLIGLVEEDSRFGTVLADLQAPLPHRRPTLEFVAHAMIDDSGPKGIPHPMTHRLFAGNCYLPVSSKS